MKRSLAFWTTAGALACLWALGAHAEGTAGDAAAKKLIKTAMEKNYMAGDFDVAIGKLNQASALCQMKGCSPTVVAEIHGSLAVNHWVGVEDTDAATQDLRKMVKVDPKFELDDTYAPPELLEALGKVRAEGPRSAAGAAPSGKPAQNTKAAEPAPTQPPPPSSKGDAEEAKRAAAEEKRAAAEEKKAEEARKAEEAKQAAEDKREAAHQAAEEKKEAARQAAEEKKAEQEHKAEEKKAEQERKAEEARKAAEEKKEAARKAADEKKEAAKRALEEKKEAARKIAEAKAAEAQRKAEEAQQRALEAARKAEEERQAKEEQRLRTPPPMGKLQETAWREQTMGYPIPVFVKVRPPPKGIERARTDVAKVVTEYAGPGMALPQQFELKALANGGGYGGHLPCEASMQEGDVTYFTTALNKYDNPVAGSGTRDKPNKVHINPVFTGKFPHLPGELPPVACTKKQLAKEAAEREAAAAAKEGGDKQLNAKAEPQGCQSNADCPDGGICSKDGCGAASEPPPVAAPKKGGCAGCRVGASPGGAFSGAALAVALAGLCVFRRRRPPRRESAART
jgi:chemotaxis protein histidine kinase CheA